MASLLVLIFDKMTKNRENMKYELTEVISIVGDSN